MELVDGGSLIDRARGSWSRLDDGAVETMLSEESMRVYMRHTLLGLEYLHCQVRWRNCHWKKVPVIHCDIKGANILIGRNGVAKLADLGLGLELDSESEESQKARCGTIEWAAPEALGLPGFGNMGTGSDIWSLGCTVIEIIT
eukprot:gene11469-3897_t